MPPPPHCCFTPLTIPCSQNTPRPPGNSPTAAKFSLGGQGVSRAASEGTRVSPAPKQGYVSLASFHLNPNKPSPSPSRAQLQMASRWAGKAAPGQQLGGAPCHQHSCQGAAEDPPGSSTASHSDHPFPQQSHPAQSWRPRMKPSQLCASAASPSDSAVVQELEQIPRTLSQIFISQPLFCVALLCFLSLSWLSLQSKQALQLLSKCWSHLTFPPQEPGVCLQHSDGACNDALRQQPQAQPHTQHWRVML